MRILTKKQQDEIISLLCENGKIFDNKDYDNFSKFHHNTAEICERIDGIKGALKYLQFMKRILEKERDDIA